MKGIYEAVAVTSDGTYRAFLFNNSILCVLEDGQPGIADQFDLDGSVLAPESLVQILVEWIYEFRRGLEIIDSRLTLGN